MPQRSSQKPLSFDRLLDALQSRPRRQLLVNLARKNPRDEADQLDELTVEGDEAAFLTRLHHVDLPKLDEMGFVEWDRRTGEITRGPQFDEIRPVIEMMIRHADELPDDSL